MTTGSATLAGVDITALIDADSAFTEQANHLNGIADLHLRDEAGTAVIREMDEFLAYADGTLIYGGRLRTKHRGLDGKAVVYRCRATTFECLLDLRVIESGVRTGIRTDAEDVVFLLGYCAGLGVTDMTYVLTLKPTGLEDIDYTGLTVRQGMDHLATIVGATYWLDPQKRPHWTDPRSTQIVVNGTFDSSAASWSLDANAAWAANSGPGGTGDGCLVTTGTGAGMHETTQTILNVIAGRRYLFVADLWSSVAAKAQVRLDWRDASSSKRIDTVTGSGASVWARLKSVYTAPTGADRVVVQLGGVNNFTGTIRHDNIALFGETAPWGVSTSPNGTTTHSASGLWTEDSEATTPINRVLIIGSGISGWRENAASIAYYGGQKFEGVLHDDRVTLASGIDSRAAWVFGKYAFPVRSGRYRTTHTGLAGGQWQIIEDLVRGITSIEWIATLTTTFIGAGQLEFEVVYGGAGEDLATTLAGIGTILTEGEMVPGLPASDYYVGSDRIVDGAVIAAKLADNAVTETKIGPDAVKSPAIYAGAITAAKIAALAIESDKIAANAVTAGKIGAGAVTAGKIGADAVESTNIAAGAVNADKLSVGAHGTALTNPDFQLGTLDDGTVQGWTTAPVSGATYNIKAEASVGCPGGRATVIALGATAPGSIKSNDFPVRPGDSVGVSVWARQVSGAGHVKAYLSWYQLNGTFISTVTVIADTTPTPAYLQYSGTAVPPTLAATGVITLEAVTTNTSVGFGDVVLSSAEYLDAAGGNVLVNGSGITITNGKLTVKNPGGTVIIDGTSDMFRIAATGTLNAPAVAEHSSGSAYVDVATGLTFNPMHLSYLTSSASYLPNVGVDAVSGIANVPFITSIAQVVNTNQTRITFGVTNPTANPTSADPGRYYLLQQAAI